jgi:hypothetical protein
METKVRVVVRFVSTFGGSRFRWLSLRFHA